MPGTAPLTSPRTPAAARPPSPVPTQPRERAEQRALALTAIESSRDMLAGVGPDLSPAAAHELAVRARALARVCPSLAPALAREAEALERAASTALIANLRATHAPPPRGAPARDPQALRLLDALADAHVAPGRATAAVTGRVVRDLGPDGVLRLAARVSMSDVVVAMGRHGATATEAHAIAERLGTNCAESLHVAVYQAVLGGLQGRLDEVRAASAPGQRAATTRAVLAGSMNLFRHMAAVGRAAEATELGHLIARYGAAAPADRPALQARAELLVGGALAAMEEVLEAHVGYMPQHLRNDQLMDLPRYFPEVFRGVARDAGLPARAAVALGTAPGGTLLERAWATRAAQANDARRTATAARAATIALGDAVATISGGGPSEVFRQTLRVADTAAVARDRALTVAAFLLSHPLAP